MDPEENTYLEQEENASYFSRYKYHIGFVVLIAAGLFMLFVVTLGYYPIIFVNNHIISQHEFMLEYGAASRYYKTAMKTYEPLLKNASSPTPADIEVSVANLLIDKNLIHDGAAKEVGSDLKSVVENKLSAYEGDTQLASAAENIYGFTPDEFKNEILIPQAEEEVLSGRLFSKGESFEDWLVDARKSAHVIILSHSLSWDGEQVIFNQ